MYTKEEIKKILLGEITLNLERSLRDNQVTVSTEVFYIIIESLAGSLSQAASGDYFSHNRISELQKQIEASKLDKDALYTKITELKTQVETEKAKFKQLDATNDKNYAIMTSWMTEKKELEKKDKEISDLKTSVAASKIADAVVAREIEKLTVEKKESETKFGAVMQAIAAQGSGITQFLQKDESTTDWDAFQAKYRTEGKVLTPDQKSDEIIREHKQSVFDSIAENIDKECREELAKSKEKDVIL